MEQLAMSFDEPERWLPVVGWEGMYEVSDLGRVRSFKGTEVRVLKTTLSRDRPTVGLSNHGRSRTYLVHTLVARAFLGPRPEGLEVCHGPTGRRDNRLVNLSYGTHLKNCGEDMRRDGTTPVGSRNGRSRLTEEMVRELRIRAAAGEARYALACEFDVSDKAIREAVSGEAWRHITDPPPIPLSELRLQHQKKPPKPSPVPADAKQVVTVRWDAPLVQAVRQHAEHAGVTVSEIIRLAVTSYLEENSGNPPKAA